MPIATSYDPGDRVVHIVLTGPIVFDEVANAMRQLAETTEHPNDVDAIWDLRGADFGKVTPEFWRQVIELRNRFPVRRTARSALVVSGNLAFGLTRQFQLMAEGVVDQELRLCTDLDDALAWIRQNPARARRAERAADATGSSD